MIYLFTVPLVPAAFILIAAWSQPSWIIRALFTAMAMIPIALFLEQLRFALPIRWRLRWPKWDAFLCSIGSHRCVPICGSKCCWECVRCEADSPSVKAYFERLIRLGIRCPMCKLDAHHGPCRWHPEPCKIDAMRSSNG